MIEITRCPKRIEKGGIVGTLDMGECLCNCAAFSSDWHKREAFDNESQCGIEYFQGHCDEYKRGVMARVRK